MAYAVTRRLLHGALLCLASTLMPACADSVDSPAPLSGNPENSDPWTTNNGTSPMALACADIIAEQADALSEISGSVSIVGRNPEDPNFADTRVGARPPERPASGSCLEQARKPDGELVWETLRKFDAQGRLSSWRDADELLSRYTYDEDGRIARITTSQLGARSTASCRRDFAYVGDLLLCAEQLCGEETSLSRWEYDDEARIVRGCHEDGGELRCTSFAYPDELVREEYAGAAIDPAQRSRAIAFLDDGRRESEVVNDLTYGGPPRELLYAYEAEGRLESLVDPIDASTRYEFFYDDQGRVIRVYPGGTAVEYPNVPLPPNSLGVRVEFERDASGALERADLYDWSGDFMGHVAFQGSACERSVIAWQRDLDALSYRLLF